MIVSLLQISLATLLLWALVGWGLVRLALPAALAYYRALLVLPVGYVVCGYIGYLGVSSVLNLRQSLVLVVLLGIALGVLAWRRGGRPRPLAALAAHWPVACIAGFATLSGVLPLLSYGHLAVIGRGWDTESYLPMVQHLLDYPIRNIPLAPAAPLRDLVASPPGIGLTLTFTIQQGYTMLLSGQSALGTFAPLLALLRGLGFLTLFVFLRATMGLGRAAALWATSCAAAGALWLWIGYFNFGMQLAAWPLIPLGLVLGIAVVDDLALRRWAAWPALLLGALAIAALPVAYYPALTVFAPMAVGIGAARMVEAWFTTKPQSAQRVSLPARFRSPPPPVAGGAGGGGSQGVANGVTSPPPQHIAALLAAAALLAGCSALLAAPTIADWYAGFSFRYSITASKIGPDRFIPPGEALGTVAFRLAGGGEQPPALLSDVALLLLAGFSVLALVLGERERPVHVRLRWLLALAPLGGYLYWLQAGRPYEYAYMKSWAYIAPLGVGVALLGWQAFVARLHGAARAMVALLPVLPLVALLWSHALVVAEHSGEQGHFGRELLAFEPVAATIPAGSTVFVSGAEALTGPTGGQVTSFLYGKTILGRIKTGFTRWTRWPLGVSPAYAVLTANEPAWPLDLAATELWRNAELVLYQFPAATQIVPGRAAWHRAERPLDEQAPGSLAVWRQAGAPQTADASQPLQIPLDTPQQVQLWLAAPTAQQITLSGGTSATLALPAGVSLVTFAAAAPVDLRASALLALIWRTQQPAPARAPAAVASVPGMAIFSATSSSQGDTIATTLRLQAPDRALLRAEVTLIEDTYDGARTAARVVVALPHDSPLTILANPVSGGVETLVGGVPTPAIEVDATADASGGFYWVALTIYHGEEPVAQRALATYRIEGGRVVGFAPVDLPIDTLRLTPAAALPGDRVALLTNQDLALDNAPASLTAVVLHNAQGTPRQLQPGTTANLQLHWRAASAGSTPLMVSAQVLDANNAKIAQWDGLLGGDWHPLPYWQAGELIRQDVPLEIAADAAPGTYRLLLTVYDPTTGQPVAIGDQQALLLGEVEVVR